MICVYSTHCQIQVLYYTLGFKAGVSRRTHIRPAVLYCVKTRMYFLPRPSAGLHSHCPRLYHAITSTMFAPAVMCTRILSSLLTAHPTTNHEICLHEIQNSLFEILVTHTQPPGCDVTSLQHLLLRD